MHLYTLSFYLYYVCKNIIIHILINIIFFEKLLKLFIYFTVKVVFNLEYAL